MIVGGRVTKDKMQKSVEVYGSPKKKWGFHTSELFVETFAPSPFNEGAPTQIAVTFCLESTRIDGAGNENLKRWKGNAKKTRN